MKKTLTVIGLLLLIATVFMIITNQRQSVRLRRQEQEIEALTIYVQSLQEKIKAYEQEEIRGVEIPKTQQIRELLDSYLRERNQFDSVIDPRITTEELRNDLEDFRMEQRFVPNRFPILDEYVISQRYTDTHKGIDLAAPLGTEVVSAAAGVIKSVYEDKYFGNVIVIDHLNHYLTFYAHLARVFHQHGFFVEKGQTIGLVGSTGFSKHPHLHFEVFYRGKNINPEEMRSR